MKEPMARDGHSGWTRVMLPLSNHNFDRLDPNLTGFPVYFNGDRVWPKPGPGITVIWPST